MEKLTFTISKNELLQHLTIVSRAVQDKAVIPALMFILFEIKDDCLVMTGSNSELQIQTSTKLTTSPGNMSFCVDKHIINILKTLPEHPVEFEITVIPNENPKVSASVQVCIIHSSGDINIAGLDAKDYVMMKEVDGKSFTLKLQNLKRGLDYTKKFADADPQRIVLHGVYVNMRSESIVFYGGTNHQVSRFEDKSISGNGFDSFIIPLSTVNILSPLLDSTDSENVHITSTNSNISFELSGTKVTSRLVDGRFPDYDRVIPSDNEIRLTTDSKHMSLAISRLLVASGVKNLIELDATITNVTLQAKNEINNKYAKENIESECNNNISIGINGEHVKEMMGIITGAAILEFSTPSRAIVIKPKVQDENTSCIFMTMPITKE